MIYVKDLDFFGNDICKTIVNMIVLSSMVGSFLEVLELFSLNLMFYVFFLIKVRFFHVVVRGTG